MNSIFLRNESKSFILRSNDKALDLFNLTNELKLGKSCDDDLLLMIKQNNYIMDISSQNYVKMHQYVWITLIKFSEFARTIIQLNINLKNMYFSNICNEINDSFENIEETFSEIVEKINKNEEKLNEFEFSIGLISKKIKDDQIFIEKVVKEKELIVDTLNENDFSEIMKSGNSFVHQLYDLYDLLVDLIQNQSDNNNQILEPCTMDTYNINLTDDNHNCCNEKIRVYHKIN